MEIALPKPVLESDVYRHEDWKKWEKIACYREDYKNPVYTQYGGDVTFELWYTERFGWVIPTLTIRNNTGRMAKAETRRSYGIAILKEQLVSVGMGPHVKRHVTIKVKESRFQALKPLLDLSIKGMEKAGDCRDRRSSRIAQTKMRRSGSNWLDNWM